MVEWHVLLGNRVLHRFWIDEGSRLKIGRGRRADVNLDNTAVSREHAILAMQDGETYLIDLGSTNGTHINGKKVSGKAHVHVDDEIEIAKFRLLSAQEKVASPVTASDFEGTVFIAPEEKRPPKLKGRKPTLTVVKGKARPASFSMERVKSITLGRARNADIVVSGWWVARTQCHIYVHENLYTLSHQGGWKATKLNGGKLRGDKQLHEGDIIEMGGTCLRFE